MAMKHSTRDDYVARIRRVQRFIRDHLDDTLELERLAQVACFSPYHFHRIFRGMTGETIAGYVRRMRLERAAVALRTTPRSVLDVALDAGYESGEAFARAFARRMGLSPSAWRALDDATIPPLVLATPACGAQGALQMDVTLETLPKLSMVALRHRGPYNTVGEAYDRLMRWAGERGVLEAGPFWVVGLSYDDPKCTPAHALRYDACIAFLDPEKMPDLDAIGLEEPGLEAVRRLELPSHRYALVDHIGPYGKMQSAFDALLGSWLPDSAYEPAPAPCIELYISPPDVPEDKRVTRIGVALAAGS